MRAAIAPPGYVASSADCDDGNAAVYPGAAEVCDGLDNDCNGVVDDGAAQTACNDGIACTTDACVAGVCENTVTAGNCLIGGVCYTDGYSPSACLSCQSGLDALDWTPMLDGSLCDDGDACTTADACQAGTCGGTPVNPDDGIPCTLDTCDPETGDVIHTPNHAACDDGLPGTVDTCNPATGCENADVDECALATDNCDPNAACVNTYGSFDCTCNPGYYGDGVTCVQLGDSAQYPGESALHILQNRPGAPSGVYWIDPDGAGAIEPFQAYCDMTTDGGGWTLVLNYVHQGGTDPSLWFRSSDLPLLGSDVLGSNESYSQYWGHASPSLLQAISFTSVRFHGRTSSHGSTLHFKTTLPSALSYFKTGSGSASGLAGSFTPLFGHSATLPGAANVYFVAPNAFQTLTYSPFGAEPSFIYWHIGGGWWAMDSNPGTGASTIHRVWVR